MKQKAPVAAGTGRVALAGQVFVMLAMAVVTVGVGIGSFAQLGMPLWAAGLLAFLLLTGMIVTHLAVLRGRRVTELEAEVVRLRSLLGPAANAATAPSAVGARKPAASGGQATAAAGSGSGNDERSLADEIAMARAMAERQPDARAQPAPKSEPQTEPKSGGTRPLDPMAIQQMVKKLADETGGPRAPLGTLPASAPATPRQEAAVVAPAPVSAAEKPVAVVAAKESAPAVASVAATDAAVSGEAITESVKALRATAEAMRPTLHPGAGVPTREMKSMPVDAPATSPSTGISKPVPAAKAAGPLTAAATAESAPPAATAAVVAEQPNAPDVALPAVHASEPPTSLAALPAEPRPDDAPAEVATDAEIALEIVEARVALLADALAADRLDVMLEPILGLKDQATRHYEVSVRLRGEGGEIVDPAHEHDVLGGTGILPLIDIAKISRIAEVARRLAERGKTGAVFAGFAGESLGDDDFLLRFAEVFNEREAIAEQLVLSLAQADVRVFADAHWDMVKDLASTGFRFALDHVTDLDMDFDLMKAAGVQFVKLDAGVFLDGLAAPNGEHVPAADIVQFFGEMELGLIVGEIADKGQLARIVDCGVLFGNGKLFGGPRVVKAQVFAAKAAAA